jgi:hypothetical protein
LTEGRELKLKERSKGVLGMNPEEKTTTLDGLYCRIEKIAKGMGGFTSRTNAERSIPAAMTADPKGESVPALFLRMPDEFLVEFAPRYPLSLGNNLSVQATRTQGGVRKSDWQLHFNGHDWLRTQNPLSDQEIRECLTPEGPRSRIE